MRGRGAMEAIDETSGAADRGRSYEELAYRALAQALMPAHRGEKMIANSAPAPDKAFERGDARSATTTPDDGGERLSTAPAAAELSGQAAQHAWGAQAAEWLMRSDPRQWNSAIAQQTTLVSDKTPALLHPSDAGVPASAAPTSDRHAPLAAPLSAGDVRDAQVGSVLDWDRYREEERRRSRRSREQR
jgi:hypothetical protein